MALFDYVTSDTLRQSLESDYAEMIACFSAKAWKAVHVLAGSIIEALLIDYLIAVGAESEDSASKIALASAIDRCENRNLISSRVASLSTVVKDYRNLIHPGRGLRLGDSVSEDTADIARRLVHLVNSEIEQQRRESYGYSASQIATKLASDPNSTLVLRHILQKTKPVELRRLLLHDLAEIYRDYVENDSFQNIELPKALTECYRLAFDLVDVQTKKLAAKQFLRLINEGSENDIDLQALMFFRIADIQYLESDEQDLVLQYLLGRMRNNPSESSLNALEGIGTYLTVDTARDFVRTVGTLVISAHHLAARANERLDSEWSKMPPEVFVAGRDSLEHSIAILEQTGRFDKSLLLRNMRPVANDEIPF